MKKERLANIGNIKQSSFATLLRSVFIRLRCRFVESTSPALANIVRRGKYHLVFTMQWRCRIKRQTRYTLFIFGKLTGNLTVLLLFTVEDNELFDFRGLRLDWCRLQAYTSVAKSQLVLSDHRDLATLLNTIAFHTKMVDALDDMLTDTSDLSIFW